MKSLIITLFSILTVSLLQAQDFNSQLAAARTAYSAKRLEEARFAMQQMLQELDVMAGKDILKMLPVQLESLSVNPSNDNVNGAAGFAGIVIHRDYGIGAKTAEIDIIGNSPMLSSINALLALPMATGNANQKIIKLEGYKALLQRNTDTDTNQTTYEIQLPLNSSLLTLKASNTTEEEVRKFAALLSVANLVKNLQ